MFFLVRVVIAGGRFALESRNESEMQFTEIHTPNLQGYQAQIHSQESHDNTPKKRQINIQIWKNGETYAILDILTNSCSKQRRFLANVSDQASEIRNIDVLNI